MRTRFGKLGYRNYKACYSFVKCVLPVMPSVRVLDQASTLRPLRRPAFGSPGYSGSALMLPGHRNRTMDRLCSKEGVTTIVNHGPSCRGCEAHREGRSSLLKDFASTEFPKRLGRSAEKLMRTSSSGVRIAGGSSLRVAKQIVWECILACVIMIIMGLLKTARGPHDLFPLYPVGPPSFSCHFDDPFFTVSIVCGHTGLPRHGQRDAHAARCPGPGTPAAPPVAGDHRVAASACSARQPHRVRPSSHSTAARLPAASCDARSISTRGSSCADTAAP